MFLQAQMYLSRMRKQIIIDTQASIKYRIVYSLTCKRANNLICFKITAKNYIRKVYCIMAKIP